jgi:pantetheine-phosphate adenylyltransferase
MNITIQKHSFNASSAYYNRCVLDKSQNSNIKNTANSSPYPVSTYKNRNFMLPFGARNIAVYAGSFDPLTKGHLDIIEVASGMYKKLYVLVAVNPEKASLIPMEDRIRLVKESLKHLKNVEVDSFEGATVDYARQKNAGVLVRGIRGESDIRYEMNLASGNEVLDPSIKTVFVFASNTLAGVSSTLVRGAIRVKHDVSNLVPEPFAKYLSEFSKRQFVR